MRRQYHGALNLPREADQASLEAATAKVQYISPAVAHYPRSASKGSGHILLSGAVPVLVTGYNIATVSGPASGMINVTLLTQMASAFYDVHATVITTSGSSNASAHIGSMTSGGFVIYIKNGSTGALMTNYVGVNVEVNGYSS